MRTRYGARAALYHLLAAAVAMTASAAAAAPKLILAFGNSLTAGYELPPADGFAPQLEAALRARGIAVTVHNAGVSGDTTAQGRARLNWVLTGLKATPDLAIVELGANDMLRGQPVAAAKANLDAILIELSRRHIRVLLAGMYASPNLGRSYATEFNAIYPALAKTHGVPLYPFFMAGVVGVPGMQLGDGLHPTRAGVATIVRADHPERDRRAAEMMRLFVAVRPPAAVREALLGAMGGVAAARWQDGDQLHLTLRFIGEVDRHAARDIAIALATVRHPPIAAKLGAFGSFTSRGRPHSLWIGVEPAAALTALHHKVDTALARAGVERDTRAFVPHITLARLGRDTGPLGSTFAAVPPSGSFVVDNLTLFESVLTRAAAVYTPLAEFPLAHPKENS